MNTKTDFDIIVIGSGSAGGILASRLTENQEVHVLLLEAGPDYPTLASLPDDIKYGFRTASGILSLSHDWGYTGTPNKYADVIPIPRGKLIGGSSSVNAQIFLRGEPDDFDRWSAAGNDLWSFEQVLPYFKRLECDLDFGFESYHGSSGLIPVRRYAREDWMPAQRAFHESCIAAGFPDCPDHNAPYTSGVGPFPLNNKDGIRQSTAITYLMRARARTNLTILPDTSVHRICFHNQTAVGLEAFQSGKQIELRAREIVLCAGAIASPQILMLSGIGPAEHLEEVGLPVVLDLPGVGKNLRDHPAVNMHWRLQTNYQPETLNHWHQVGLRYTAAGSDLVNDMIFYTAVNPYQNFLFFRPTINLALSHGEVRLRSANPEDPPMLNYRYFSNPFDLSREREAVRMADTLVQHHEYEGIIEAPLQPRPEIIEADEHLDAWILKSADTGHHSAGTCKMGPVSDSMAVVNQRGEVHGLKGLRVVDASIMPDCVRANINATTMMMAERLAEFIA